MRTRRRTILVLLAGAALVGSTAVAAHADTVPGAPTKVFAIGYVGSARVGWYSPADDGGSAITGYRIRDTVSGTVWTRGPELEPATITGLTNGVTLTLRVAAVNALGTGPESAPFSVAPHAPYAGPVWKPAANAAARRHGATSAVLRDGRVLVVGGYNTVPGSWTPLTSAEVYTPATNTWATVKPMPAFRDGFTLTTLTTGKVLLAGGSTAAGVPDRRAWLFDPTTNTWTATGNMTRPRTSQSGTLLRDGTVLAAGGTTTATFVITKTSETYNPTTGTWKAAGNMLTARTRHLAVRLADRAGRVLVAGGHAGGTGFVASELYQPSTRTWAATGAMKIARHHDDAGQATITLLTTGRVLVAGGYRFGPTEATTGPQRTAEVYDPATGVWSLTRNMVYATEAGHTATRLPSGVVVVAGGRDDYGNLAVTQAFNPTTGRWSRVNDLRVDRFEHIAALLSGGRILVSGGTRMTPYGTLRSSEIYTP